MGPGPRGPPHPGMRPGFPPMMGPGGPGGPMGPNPGDNRMLVPNSGDKSSTNPTFATVKASAPNTIQYLPTRPQYDSRPRGPPSLEFLQKLAMTQFIMFQKTQFQLRSPTVFHIYLLSQED